MNTVETIKQQLVDGGLKTRGLVFVAMDADTLKVSRKDRGALITHVAADDTYRINKYNGFNFTSQLNGITVDNLMNALRGAF